MTTETAPGTGAPVIVEPQPGTPEHRDAMIAKYDAQFPQATLVATPVIEPKAPEATTQPATAAPAAPGTEAPTDPNPRLSDPPTDPKDSGAPKDGEKPPTAPSLADLFDNGEFATGFAAETLPENLSKALEGAGFKGEQLTAMHEQFRAGQEALKTLQTMKLQEAAGGKEQFAALVTWGKANLTPEQAKFYDGELNGPNAAEVIALLTQKMNAGRDPKLHVVSPNAAPPNAGFKSQQEVVAAMSDPRYASDPAYRNQVRERLRVSRY